MELTISGAGPSGGGGSKFTTRPDTLRSNDTFEGLLGLCVGPIKGPTNGMKSIRVNQTPIEDTSGNQNFQDFQAIFADGDPLKFPQKVSLRLGAAGAPLNIGVQLRNIGGTNSVWVTRTVTNTGAQSLDLRFDVSQLYRQDKKGIYGTTASVEIQMKPVGTTTWINPFNANGNTLPAWNPNGYDLDDGFGSTVKQILTQATYNAISSGAYGSYLTINGKTTSPFVKELRIKVPNSGTYANVGWDVRCRLVENESLDADPNFEKRTLNWESITAVYDTALGDHEDWRGLAWLQLYGKASDSFNGIPEMDGVYDTKIVSVPPSTVFNPDTRVYTGAIWDGSWAKSYTNDPAWVINDAITDSLSGIARLVPGAQLNKWDALELSKYCSQLVSNGDGGQHPRFSLNLAVSEAQRSDEFIRYLAGACAATAWDEGEGEWRCVVDKPQAPAALFTHENIEGEFNYSHTDVDTRFNDVTVVFLNEEFDYREDRVKIEDPDHIALFGRKPTKVVAIGCTHRQQAVRWAILKMRTNVNEFRNVSFTTNRQGKLLERFNWILIADGSLNQTLDDTKRTTGRIVENKGSSIVLRDTIRIELGVNYTIAVTTPNPAYDPDSTTAPSDPTWQQPTVTITRTVTNSAGQRGDVREIFINSPLPADVAENANIALSALGLPSVPKVYRVIDADYNDDGERVTINAIEVDTGKYDAADLGDYDYHMPGYDGSGGDVPSPVAPAAGVLQLNTVSDAVATTRLLTASWQRPVFGHIKGYRIERRLNDSPWIQLGFTTDLKFELASPESGHHEFRVYTIDNHNRLSLPLYDDIVIDTLPEFAPVGFLTNESHTVASAADGTGFSLAGAGGQFILYSPAGQINTDVVFSVQAQSGATATIGTDGTYAITALTADTATVTFRAVWFSYVIDKVYTISKSKGGANAKLLYVISDRQTLLFDSAGNPTPAVQTVTFTAQKQNTTAVVTWSVYDANGAIQSAAAGLSATTGDTVTMTVAQFNAVRNGTLGVIVKGTLTDGVTLSDQISVVRVGQGATGATGPAGPTISLNADDGTFDFIDGIPFNTSQVVTLTATRQNTSEALNWTTSPTVTLGGAAGATTRTLSLADFGSNTRVTVTVTGAVSGASSSVNLVRDDQTTPNDSIIPDSAWTGTVQGTIDSGGTPTPDPGGEIYEPPAGVPWSRNGRFRVQRA